MRYLLDSNILLWFIENNKRLGKKTLQLLLDTETQNVVVSVVSLWEIYIKVSIGKLQVDIDLEEFCNGKNIPILPVLPNHTKQILTLPHIHRDPFDRMLLAQSLSEHLTFITSDSNILQYPKVRLVDARQ